MTEATIDWGDGTSESFPVDVVDGAWTLDEQAHEYAAQGVYQVTVVGPAGGEDSSVVHPKEPEPATFDGIDPDTYAYQDGGTFTVTGSGLSETTKVQAPGYVGAVTPDSVSATEVVFTIPAQTTAPDGYTFPTTGLVTLQRDDWTYVAKCDDPGCLTVTDSSA